MKILNCAPLLALMAGGLVVSSPASAASQRGQVFAAYETLLRAGHTLPEQRQYTAMGKLLPLPTQWALVRRAIPGVTIPTFRYGYGPELVSAEAWTTQFLNLHLISTLGGQTSGSGGKYGTISL